MNNKYKILIVEEEKNIQNFVTALLVSNDFQVISAGSCREANMLYASYNPDLVILDLGLPDDDGSEVLREIRKTDLTPVIVLSARTSEQEKVRLLDMGANDYITKPFGSNEMIARIKVALRETRHSSDEGRLPGGRFTAGNLMIDYDSRQVFIEEKEIKLTQTEYNILAFLSAHRGKVMTYSSIIKSVWRESPTEASIKKLQVNMANIAKSSVPAPER